MQLDHTQISIRERSLLEILDLSLHVARVYLGPLLLMFACGVIPCMIANQLLIGWLAESIQDGQFPYSYMWQMLLLVYVQGPLASIFATCYLGQAVFQERPSIRQVVVDVLGLWLNIGWCQLVIRVVAPVFLLYLFFGSDEDSAALAAFGIHVLVFIALFIRGFRPFINEIVVLERNPLRSNDREALTIGKRSKGLHGPASSELFGRWMASTLFAGLLWMAFYGLFLFASGVFFNNWRQGTWAIQLCYPLSLWMVVFYFTVVRFLSYLDTRIRQEGWEVELKLRAEAAKLPSEVG